MKLIVDNKSTKVVIGGKDNLITHINIREELDKALMVRNENSFHITQFMRQKGRKFHSDGYFHLLTKANTFATGFLPMVINLVEGLGIPVEVEDKRINLPVFKEELDFQCPEFYLAEHQQQLVKAVNNYIEINGEPFYFPRGQWEAATNSGKTAASGCVVQNVVNPSAIMLVDSQLLFEQHIEYFTKVFGDIGKIGSVHVGYTKSGKPKYEYVYSPKPPFTIAMVGSLHSKMKKSEGAKSALWNTYNILICDESHGFSGNQAVEVINAINAGMVLFMSGTPLHQKSKLPKAKLIGMSGRIIHKISKEQLMNEGYSMRAHIKMYLNPFEQPEATDYDQEEQETILKCIPRAELIAELISKRTKRKILITFNERVHGYLMYQTFIENYPHLADRAAWVHGMDKDKNEKKQDYIDGKIQFLFTSTIMQQGINVKDIQTIIYAIGGKDTIPLSQFMGRGERLDGIDTDFEFIDIFDRGRKLSSHSLARLEFYRKENLPLALKYNATKTGRPR